MKRPESTDFEVKVFDVGADVIFKPTSSYTDGYDPSEVLAEARRVALRAAQAAYEKNE